MLFGVDKQTPKWDKPGVEVPPGWHAAVQAIADRAGVKMKYVYALALQLLFEASENDHEALDDRAWVVVRRTKKDLAKFAKRYTADQIKSSVVVDEIAQAAEQNAPQDDAPRRQSQRQKAKKGTG